MDVHRVAACLCLPLIVLLSLQGMLQPLHVLTHHACSPGEHDPAVNARACSHACHAHACRPVQDEGDRDDESSPEHDDHECGVCLALALARHVTVDADTTLVYVVEPLVERVMDVQPRPASREQRGPLRARAPPRA